MDFMRRLALVASFLLALGSASTAQAHWLRAESPLFIVYSDGDEAGLRAFTDRLERFDATLRLLTGAKGPPAVQKLTVYLVPGHHTLAQVYPDSSSNVFGFYNAAASGIEAVAVRTDNAELFTGQQVLFHEYTHHFMLQYFPGAYPAWYQEGFAEFCSTVTFRPDGVEFGKPMPNRMMWLLQSPWMPIETLFTTPSRQALQDKMFYPEAWLATHYLLRHPEEQAKMKRYIAALRRGEPPGPTFRNAFGMDFAAFQKLLSAYASKGIVYTRLTLPTGLTAGAITVTSVPPSADRLLLDHARLSAEHVADKDKVSFLAQVRSDAALFPDDALALRTLALAEIEAGDPAAADVPLDKLLQATPDDLEGLYLKGLRYVMSGWKDAAIRGVWFPKARPFLVRAYRLDPHYAPALWLLGVSLNVEGGKPSENELNALGNAHFLAPQVPDYAMSDADALMRAERYAEAADVLEDLAYSAHSGGGSATLKMLEQARSHLAKPDLATPAASESTAP